VNGQQLRTARALGPRGLRFSLLDWGGRARINAFEYFVEQRRFTRVNLRSGGLLMAIIMIAIASPAANLCGFRAYHGHHSVIHDTLALHAVVVNYITQPNWH
jgi:hypothetical protein